METTLLKNKRKKGSLLITLGLLLIAAALGLTAWNLYDEHRAEQSVSQVVEQLDQILPPAPDPDFQTIEVPDYVLNPDMERPVETIDGQNYIGVLSIPALELELPIISEWSYPRLKTAPCRYTGSVYKNDMIIAAHNYASHFGNLKYLQEGDEVAFTDMDGNVFRYEVALQETLQPTAITEIQQGDWDLTLFTCTIGGAYRVTVRCQRTDDPFTVWEGNGSEGKG